MNRSSANLITTLIAVSDFGAKYTANFPAGSVGEKQFTIIGTLVKDANAFGKDQFAGSNEGHAGVLSKAVAHAHLHDDMLAINHAAHSLGLLGNVGIEGKFRMPHKTGDRAYIDAGLAFEKEATPYVAQFVEVGMDANFLLHLKDDIAAYEQAIVDKTSGIATEGGATGGLSDAAHKAVIALHILDNVVRNVFKNDPAKLAEWTVARHIQRPPRHNKPPTTTATGTTTTTPTP